MANNEETPQGMINWQGEIGKIIGRKDRAEALCVRAELSLDWMVADMKRRHDECGISPGNYSKELTEAINLLEDISKRKVNNG